MISKLLRTQVRLGKPHLSRFCFSSKFLRDEDIVIDVGEPRTTIKGMLIIVPTPIGNLSDMTLRQYEALKTADIIAAEDTRKTGQLFELLEKKKLGLRFKEEFGYDMEQFYNEGKADEFMQQTHEGGEEVGTEQSHLSARYEEQTEIMRETNYQQEIEELLLENQVTEQSWKRDLGYPIEKDQYEDLSDVQQEYYSKVKDAVDYERRKQMITDQRDKLRAKVEYDARTHDLRQKLKRVFKHAGSGSNYGGRDGSFKEEQSQRSAYEEAEEELESMLGVEGGYSRAVRDKIEKLKKKKGRGLMVSYHDHVEEKRIPKLLRAMKLGFRVALVSDAGTPGISDPGYLLIREASKQGIPIESLPGCTAVTTAVCASGFPCDEFHFLGYIPKQSGLKVESLRRLHSIGKTIVAFDSTHRIESTLQTIAEIYGENHEVYIGLELTKIHEDSLRGEVVKVLREIESRLNVLKGELTLVIAGRSRKEIEEEDEELIEKTVNPVEVAKLLESKVSMSDTEFKRLLSTLLDLPHSKAKKLVEKVRIKAERKRVLPPSISLGKNLR